MEYQMETIPQNGIMLNVIYFQMKISSACFVWSHRKNNIMHYSKQIQADTCQDSK